MYRGCSVAVVVPAYNEEERVAPTVCSIPGFVDHVLVVDDGSTDLTYERVRPLNRRGLEVIRHRDNGGVGAAIFTGYRRALELGADRVAVMAGDNQMDPRDLPALLDAFEAPEVGYVKGNRFKSLEVLVRMPKTRLVGNVALSLLTRAATGYRHVFDSQCGYTVFRREALERVDLDRVYGGYGYCNDLLGHLRCLGVEVRDVGVRPVYAGETSGIRITTVVHPIMWVLARVWLRCRAPNGNGRAKAAYGPTEERPLAAPAR
jgi:glycosyltransferase involved in cell wall biosynthesis